MSSDIRSDLPPSFRAATPDTPPTRPGEVSGRQERLISPPWRDKGLPDVLVDRGLSIFFRKPRSKKRRIIEKWAKRSENYRCRSYIIDGRLVVSPMVARLFEEMRKKVEDEVVRNMMVPREIAWMNESREPTKAEIMATIGEFPHGGGTVLG